MNAAGLCFIFVYGTLQTGEERAGCWPHAPLAIVTAEISAEIYDLGDYPAIIPGGDRVAGELWELHPTDMPRTLAVLDEIEGYGQGEADLYLREVVTCRTSAGAVVTAYTYWLADAAFARQHARITPDLDGLCRWHRHPQKYLTLP